jgi:hypothetical protein
MEIGLRLYKLGKDQELNQDYDSSLVHLLASVAISSESILSANSTIYRCAWNAFATGRVSMSLELIRALLIVLPDHQTCNLLGVVLNAMAEKERRVPAKVPADCCQPIRDLAALLEENPEMIASEGLVFDFKRGPCAAAKVILEALSDK